MRSPCKFFCNTLIPVHEKYDFEIDFAGLHCEVDSVQKLIRERRCVNIIFKCVYFSRLEIMTFTLNLIVFVYIPDIATVGYIGGTLH
jgi:hypothetical protein